MKNEDIIENERRKLLEKSLIGANEELHTYAEWRRRGFTVQKGCYAISKVILWKHKISRRNGEVKEVIFQKNASLFATHQVEPSRT